MPLPLPLTPTPTPFPNPSPYPNINPNSNQVEPDVFTTAKALGGGVPIGAMLCKSRADVFKPGDHASTYGGNPLASAAGNAVLDAFEKRNVIDNVWPPAAPARPHPRPHGPRHTAPCRLPPATRHVPRVSPTGRPPLPPPPPLPPQVNERSEQLKAGLNALAQKHGIVSEVRS